MNAKRCILVTGADLAPEAFSMLSEYQVIFTGFDTPTDEFIGECRKYNPVGIIVRYGGIVVDAMDAAPALKVLARHGSGTDTIDMPAASARGIAVCTNIGGNSIAVAEHAMALLMTCAKSTTLLDDRVRSGYWDKVNHKSFQLQGHTIGLIGLGVIGQRFAKICDAIGMRVIGYTPVKKELPNYIEQVELNTIWEESDVISLHCPLKSETKEIINAKSLGLCKNGAIIINTGRGGLIDEEALYEALVSKRISSAGLDCLTQEPPKKDHPFFKLPNVVLSPHIAGSTQSAYVAMGVNAATNLLRELNKL